MNCNRMHHHMNLTINPIDINYLHVIYELFMIKTIIDFFLNGNFIVLYATMNSIEGDIINNC